ncbi:MAG: response regulator [Anaeromyxobacter sp.]
MSPCPLCAAPLPARAAACSRCGIAAPARTRLPARRTGGIGWLTRAAGALLGLALLGAFAASGWRALTPGSCEPRTLSDWRTAVHQACVTPDYVCRNLTAPKLLSDPELLARYHAALLEGQGDAALELEALVAHVRAAYGCAAPSRAARRLPPGHPPSGRRRTRARRRRRCSSRRPRSTSESRAPVRGAANARIDGMRPGGERLVSANPTILLVEDDSAIRESVRECLELEGYEIVSAPNGAEGLRWLKDGGRPRLVVLDLVMPVMNGTQFLEALAADATLRELPVVLMTAAMPTTGSPLPTATAYLSKPFELGDLLDAVERLARR